MTWLLNFGYIAIVHKSIQAILYTQSHKFYILEDATIF